MSPEQYERLPDLLKEIVDLDRRMITTYATGFPSVLEWREYAEMRKTRKRLKIDAERIWGYRAKGKDNTKGEDTPSS